MLFYDDELAQWNANEVLKVSPRRSVERHGAKRWVQTITFKNGGELIAGEQTVAGLYRVALDSFPAEPGYRVVTWEEDEELSFYTVIGWAITIGMGVVPITIEGVNCGVDGALSIVLPSGQVQIGAHVYANLDEYKAHMTAPSED